MLDLRVERGLALQLDKAHCWPGRALGNRLRILLVILLRLDVGLDVLRRHETDLVALLPQDAAEVVSAAARLHRHRTSRQLGAEPDNAVSREPSPKDDAARLIETRDAAAVVAEIDNRPSSVEVGRAVDAVLSDPRYADRAATLAASFARHDTAREILAVINGEA